MKLFPVTPERRHILLLGLFIFMSFFLGLGSGPLFDVDEGAFTEATREMLESGNWLTTYLNGIPRFDKPILIYWLQALSVWFYGLNELALRLPSAVAGAFWAIATWRFTSRERGKPEGFLAASLLVLSLQVTIIAKAAIADSLLNCLLAVSMFAIFGYWRNKRRSQIYVAFAAMGFGVLTKGPVAILIPLVVSFLFFLAQRDLRNWFRAILNPAAIALFLVIVLPWYTLEYLDQGQAFIEGFFLKHNVSRFSASMEGHSGSLFYYLPVILIGALPATGLLFPMLYRIKSLVADPLASFCLIWTGFVFLFFSLSGTKLPHYMIYGYTPLFILLGQQLARSRRPWLHALWPAGMLFLLSAAPFILSKEIPSIESAFVRAQLQAFIRETALSGFTPLLAGAGLLCLLLQALRPASAHLRFLLGGALLTLSVNTVVMPAIARVMQAPVKEAALFAKERRLPVVMWKVYYPSFFVYSGSFAERRKPGPGEVVLTSVDHIGKLPGYEVLYQKNGIVMARVTPAR